MSARAVHSANIYKDMFSNTGALTLVMFLHSRKRYLPGAVSFGMFSSPVKPQHLKKAYSPVAVTLERSTFLSVMHSRKARSPTVVTLEKSTTSSSALHPSNALVPMVVILDRSIVLSVEVQTAV